LTDDYGEVLTLVMDMKGTNADKIKNVEQLSKEVVTMRKELEDVKEVLKGLIQVVMGREENLDEDEYN
jgi:hypothetical protein